MTQSGWRKPTPGLGRAERLAEVGEQRSCGKAESLVAVKRVAAHLGLKAADVLLLDTLAAFTQAQDWEEGRRPIVWPSNAYLMERTGFSLSTLKRHMRRLAETGLIAFHDSPNGKRWGRRDAEGRIVEAYGFDLGPLAARVAEFADLHAVLEAERAECQRLRRQITIARRSIRARLEAALEAGRDGPWARLVAQFEALLERLPRPGDASARILAVLDRFKALGAQVERYFMAGEPKPVVDICGTNSPENAPNSSNLTPREVNSGPHILPTKHLQSVICNSFEKEKEGDVCFDRHTSERKAEGEHDVKIELATILRACPEFATWAHNLGGHLRDWGDFVGVCAQLRPMIGVSEDAWQASLARLGPASAAAALALVFEKFTAGEVTSPGGYLRGMIGKAGAGELHLERSIYGRLSAVA